MRPHKLIAKIFFFVFYFSFYLNKKHVDLFVGLNQRLQSQHWLG